eukprot:Lithocolla_globosa_v1_NODE_3918_length_1550_cov_3.914439.p1 type:complete len:184 gc:universal NODE_3918_length_1550_cov_3.914439:1312-761(-)
MPAKIPLLQTQVDNLKTEYHVRSAIVNDLFVINGQHCTRFYEHVLLKVTDPVKPGRTEASYHALVDCIIKHTIDNLVASADTDRDTNRQTSNRDNRPDFIWLWKNWCLFRGEEKKYDQEDPQTELTSKLDWDFPASVPYLLGYHLEGPQLTFDALYEDDGGIAVTSVSATFNLTSVDERCSLF